MLDALHPGLRYANLAIRGRRIRDVLDDQLPRALAMRPDLISVCVGMNDITRPGLLFDRALADLDLMHQRLAQSGATVLTTTFPDIGQIVPIGRILTSRMLRTNEAIATASEHYGFRLVDLYGAASMTQPDVWSGDRVHGSTKGHMLFAAAAAEALDLPGSSHDWAHCEPEGRDSRRCVHAPIRKCCGPRTCWRRGYGTTRAGYPAVTAVSRSAPGWPAWSVRSRAQKARAGSRESRRLRSNPPPAGRGKRSPGR